MGIPDWVPEAIVYQIFPDRFANGDLGNDPPNVQPWGSVPDIYGFQGGDLRGIILRLEYLQDLGVNTIYLNPIFLSPSNHRYNITDYYRLDPLLGSNEEFRELVQRAHHAGMRVILDGVFNHCSRGFFAFADILENQERSPYRDWFHIRSFPVRAYGKDPATEYVGWWNHRHMPKFNTDDPGVRRYLLGVARHWIEQGADGWRLDVPNEIDDDGFWAEFRHTVKTANPEAYLVGEIWTVDPRWVGPEHFDGLIQYPVREAVLASLGTSGEPGLALGERLEECWRAYPETHRLGHITILGNHDTVRLWTALENDSAKARLATLLQFTYPGAPGIYYGDEIGMQGAKDPGCRGAFAWDPSHWNQGFRNYVKDCIALRRRLPQLRRGDFAVIRLPSPAALAFRRGSPGDPAAAIVANLTAKSVSLEVDAEELGWGEDWRVIEQLSTTPLQVHQGILRCELAPLSGGVYLPG